jgi:phenylacetate-CoA ligase
MGFSFGPFIGFWAAAEALVERGCLMVSGGGMNARGRLELIESLEVTALFCTPTYALHLAETAVSYGIDLRKSSVTKVVVAGEPGGSVPSIRRRIEDAWGARLTDHSGAREVGPWGYGDADGTGLYVVESEFIAEFLSSQTGGPGGERDLSELVLTSLGRPGCPVLRYRTGDLVRPALRQQGSIRFVFLEGGVIGRVDDMLTIRGVNVFPSAIEEIIRGFPEIVEYRMTATRVHELDQLAIEIEDHLGWPARVADELHLRLGLRIDVRAVPLGTLPRSEGKGIRFVDQRG